MRSGGQHSDADSFYPSLFYRRLNTAAATGPFPEPAMKAGLAEPVDGEGEEFRIA
jgi:hypothetical protein